MGLNRTILEMLIRLHERREWPAHAAVVELGAQQVGNSFFDATELIDEVRRRFGVDTPLPIAPIARRTHLPGGYEQQSPDAPPARAFWQWIGCTYASIDIDGSPDSIPLDLNYDSVPGDARHRFDLVTNFGTTEHVANQLNAFKVMHDLAAPGGLILHDVPALGMLNHGLVTYTPNFFWKLARSNGYDLLYMDFRAGGSPYPVPQNLVDCVAAFQPDIVERAPRLPLNDASLVVLLRKVADIEFVPPLDVPNGTRSSNPLLQQRYWTVLTPDGQTRLGQLRRGAGASAVGSAWKRAWARLRSVDR